MEKLDRAVDERVAVRVEEAGASVEVEVMDLGGGVVDQNVDRREGEVVV